MELINLKKHEKTTSFSALPRKNNQILSHVTKKMFPALLWKTKNAAWYEKQPDSKPCYEKTTKFPDLLRKNNQVPSPVTKKITRFPALLRKSNYVPSPVTKKQQGSQPCYEKTTRFTDLLYEKRAAWYEFWKISRVTKENKTSMLWLNKKYYRPSK